MTTCLCVGRSPNVLAGGMQHDVGDSTDLILVCTSLQAAVEQVNQIKPVESDDEGEVEIDRTELLKSRFHAANSPEKHWGKSKNTRE